MVKTRGGFAPTVLQCSGRNKSSQKTSPSSPVHINLELVPPIMDASANNSIAAKFESKSLPTEVNNPSSSQGGLNGNGSSSPTETHASPPTTRQLDQMLKITQGTAQKVHTEKGYCDVNHPRQRGRQTISQDGEDS
ncbi:unnamed protein product [Cuscuta epithymum]|uniref:Uncharacterized protein n=1 Tax=Cuscuta epithymum TaxID=186058 RepID=A0AAV0CVT2_9ASTE|nr:unnamed protein product [Cuscuta epithymum]